MLSPLPKHSRFVVPFSRSTIPLGDLLAAVFDEAARYSNDPQKISRMTAEVMENLLRRARLQA